jgi:hypothetical protein
MTYQRLYDAAIKGFLTGLTNHTNLLTLFPTTVSERKEWVRDFLTK